MPSNNEFPFENFFNKGQMPSAIAEGPTNEVPTQTPPKQSPKNHRFTLDIGTSPEDFKAQTKSKFIEHARSVSPGQEIDPKFTFETYIHGPNNQMAWAVSKAIAHTPGKAGRYPQLLLYGPSGLGKTHLLHAIANEIRELHPQLVVCLISANHFLNEMVQKVQENKIHEFAKKYTERIDVLMLDDVHMLKGKKELQEQFFQIFNELYQRGRQLILTSDKNPREIIGLEERIITRLQQGLIIEVKRPDLETRLAILKKKSLELDLFCPEEVLLYIAKNSTLSIRDLGGQLLLLNAYNGFMKADITLELAKELLHFSIQETNQELTLDRISFAVGQYFKIPVVDLRSKSRAANITHPRHIAIHLCRKLLQSTQQELGNYFGGRDHTSILHALKKIDHELTAGNSTLNNEVSSIESSLQLN